ncbi:hypothetical protein [Microcystis phage Mae-JY09]
MSLPEHCANHAPVPWAEIDQDALRRMRAPVGAAIQQTFLALAECDPADDPADAERLAWRLVDLTCRWRELSDEGGAP